MRDSPAQPIIAEMAFTNARLVLEDKVRTGSLLVRDGQIAAVGAGAVTLPNAIDCEGDYLAPGVNRPHRSAVIGHDAELASARMTGSASSV